MEFDGFSLCLPPTRAIPAQKASTYVETRAEIMGMCRGISIFVALSCGLLGAATAGAQARLFDESSMPGYEYRGPYAQLGGGGGVIDPGISGLETGVGGGFTLTGGWRALSWLSGEVNLSYLTGGNVQVGGVSVGEASFFAFSFGPKLYPLGALEIEAIPQFIQPYGLVGVGGGEFEFKGSGIDTTVDTFIARFLVGFDVWATKSFGLFAEGGYHLATADEVDGAGIFTFGAQARF